MAKGEIKSCFNCGKERLVMIRQLKSLTYTGLCQDCARRSRWGKNNPNYKGGRCNAGDGHIFVRLYPDDFFYPMATSQGYAKEHRLIMAKHLGRNLHSWEYVHHKNGDKSDNRIENLEIQTPSDHLRNHSKGYRDGYRRGLVDGRNIQIEQLKEEIRILKSKGIEYLC